jgi:hypothetical protein
MPATQIYTGVVRLMVSAADKSAEADFKWCATFIGIVGQVMKL